MSFKDQLRAAREARGYTQQQIADLMGIDKSTYCGYETGKRQPDVQKLKLLCNILGVSGDDLLETGRAVATGFNAYRKDNVPPRSNIIKIAGRNGSYEERILTDEQIDALKVLLSQLPDASGDL